MHNSIKHILQWLNWYHPLQHRYRAFIQRSLLAKYRKAYQPYKGSGFTCNVCHAVYSRLVPHHPSSDNKTALEKNNVIAGYGENILCPNCLSNARERLVIAMLQSKIPFAGKQILHLSPEQPVYKCISASAHVTTADFVPGFYRHIDPQVQFQDLHQLTYPNNYFDLLIGNHILEHIPDDALAMRELYRVLKPGGTAILQVPYSETIHQTLETPTISDPKQQSLLYGQQDHVRIYAKEDYAMRLRVAGFKVHIIGYDALQHFYKYAIQQGECFFQIEKPLRLE